MAKANYEIVKETPHQLYIQDVGPWSQFQTVTNAAEETVAELLPVLKGRRLLYYDSEGDLGELLITDDGVFNGYAPAQAADHS